MKEIKQAFFWGIVLGACVTLLLSDVHCQMSRTSEPQFYRVPDHPAHTVEFNKGVTVAQGEGTMMSVPTPPERPLGDVARDNKALHATVKKAVRKWEQ